MKDHKENATRPIQAQNPSNGLEKDYGNNERKRSMNNKVSNDLHMFSSLSIE